jgi:hypothetical protein
MVAILQTAGIAIHDLHQRLNPVTGKSRYGIVRETLKTGSNRNGDTSQDQHQQR